MQNQILVWVLGGLHIPQTSKIIRDQYVLNAETTVNTDGFWASEKTLGNIRLWMNRWQEGSGGSWGGWGVTIYIYMYMCVCVYILTYIYTHIHRKIYMCMCVCVCMSCRVRCVYSCIQYIQIQTTHGLNILSKNVSCHIC